MNKRHEGVEEIYVNPVCQPTWETSNQIFPEDGGKHVVVFAEHLTEPLRLNGFLRLYVYNARSANSSLIARKKKGEKLNAKMSFAARRRAKW